MRWAKAEQEGSRGTDWFTHSFIHVFIFAPTTLTGYEPQ